jgi:aminopeptidase N
MKVSLLILAMMLVSITLPAQWGIQMCQDKHKRSSSSVKMNQAATGHDILHYNLYVDSVSFSGQSIHARAEITVKAEQSLLDSLSLDLLGFDIDSVFSLTHTVTYSYNDTVLSMQISPPVATGDSTVIRIHYHGTPAQDPSGWGGFYFSGNYAFNLGVGFQADPHNFGRAWYPCEDNFKSRATYDFYITTDAGSKAFCNGLLQSSTVNPNGRVTWHWKMNQTIPSYLVSMAIAPYHTLQRTSNGIPVEWAAMAADTNAVLATFSNLDTTLSAFINAYGPYPFDKVGYCLVPFNSGAMEHASSIHIGRAFVNGSQTYATLWAHELAHMWWGDKVTCATAEDMWLNEGFASFNEAYYTEVVSGIDAYRNWIRANHRKVLQFAHTPAQDGSYLTLNNIPHEYTYGYHVYQKGANVAHTLRHYMGDTSFFNGCQNYFSSKAYSHASSQDLRDELTTGSGIDMTRFFDDWVFTPGFPHFSIDSVVYVPGGLDHYFVYTRQRSKGNNHLYAMPVDIHFTDGIIDTIVRVVIDSATNMFHIPIYFYATHVFLDRYGNVSDARVSNEKVITATGVQPVAETSFTLNVQSVGSPSSMVRVEHNFVPPDPFISSNPGIRLSDYRYWKIDGFFNPGFLTKGLFIFDGTTSASTGYLDNNLITGVEDSLVLLYRQGPGYEWIIPSYTINFASNPNDKRGSLQIDSLLAGEYTLGYFDFTVGVNQLEQLDSEKINVVPNPSSDRFTFFLPAGIKENSTLIVFDTGGRKIYETQLSSKQTQSVWDASNAEAGMYHAVLNEEGKRVAAIKLMVVR